MSCESDMLEQFQMENERLKSEVSRLQRDLADPPGDIQELVIKKLNLVSGEALDRANAACAESKRVLIRVLDWCCSETGEPEIDADAVREAISSDAGKAFLEELTTLRRECNSLRLWKELKESK